MTEVAPRVNGQAHRVTVYDPNMPLLYALRDDLGLRGPKFGCGLGQCGACCVLINGEAARSCVTLAIDAHDKEITTLEGLGDPDRPSKVQAAFIAEQATRRASGCAERRSRLSVSRKRWTSRRHRGLAASRDRAPIGSDRAAVALTRRLSERQS